MTSTAGRAGSSIAAAAGLIAVTTLLARITGFARILVFSDSVGAKGVGSVYQSINALPNVLYEVAAGGILAAVAIPLIAGHLGAQSRESADRTTSALLTWALVVLVPVAVVLAIAAPWLSQWLLGSTSDDSVDAGTWMLRLFAPQVVLYGIGIVLSGHLQAHRRFLAAAIAPLLSSLVVIATYLVYGPLSKGELAPGQVPGGAVTLLAVGTTLGVVALSLPLVIPAVGTGWRYRPTLSFAPGDTRRVGTLAAAGVLALAAQQAAVLATNWLANNRGDQVFVVYQYVQAVYLLPYAVLAVPIATSAFPALAQSLGSGQAADEQTSRTLARSLRSILVLAGLGAAVLVAVARPVGSFFLALDRSRDRGGAEALAALPDSLVAFAPGLIGFGAAALLTRSLYLRGRPLQAAVAVALGWLVAGGVPFLLVTGAGDPGGTLRSLGFASTLGMTLSALLLARLVSRSWGSSTLAGLRQTVLGAVVAFAAAGGVGDVLAYEWQVSGLLPSVGVGAVVAVVATAVFVAVMLLLDRSSVLALRWRGRLAPTTSPGGTA